MDYEVSVLNGYPIKDKTARQGLANLETALETETAALANSLKTVAQNGGNYADAFKRECYIKREPGPNGVVEKLVVKAGKVPAQSGTSVETGVTLDTVAYGGLTYRQIFEECNLLGFQSMEEPLPPGRWTKKGHGTIERTTEAAFSGNYSLKVVSSGAIGGDFSGMTYMEMEPMFMFLDETYFSALKVRCDSFSADAGVAGAFLGNIRNGVTKTTGGRFVTTSYTYKVPQSAVASSGALTTYNRIGFASASTASGHHEATFYVDIPVLVRVSALWDNMPDHSTMLKLYDNYAALKSAGTLSPVTYEEETFVLSAPETTMENGLARFVQEMNSKAQKLGMTSTQYVTASGMATNGTCVSTVRDLARLGVAACGYNEILRCWSGSVEDITIGGANPRTIQRGNIIDFEEYSSLKYNGKTFQFVGGKGGSWADDGGYPFATTMILLSVANNGKKVVSVVAGTNDMSIATASYECLHYADEAIKGNGTAGTAMTTGGCVSAIACEVPELPAAHDGTALKVLYEYNADAVGNCASTAKVMTAILAMERTADLYMETVTIKDIDDVGYSGDLLFVGEKITMRDAVALMLHLSSNMTAEAVGRTIGGKMLKASENLKV